MSAKDPLSTHFMQATGRLRMFFGPAQRGTTTGPTAASGGAPSAEYPAGIKAAPSGDTVSKSGTREGPGEGATAIGGVTPSANVTPPPTGNATAPTAGDGAPAAPKP